MPIVVIARAGAVVGPASVEGFARHGYAVGLLGRNRDRLKRAASDTHDRHGARASPISTGVAEAEAMEPAASRVAPVQIDGYLAKAGYTGQLTDQREPADASANLFELVPGDHGAYGRFDNRPSPETGRYSSTGTAPPFSPPRLSGRARCCTRSPDRWMSERLR